MTLTPDMEIWQLWPSLYGEDVTQLPQVLAPVDGDTIKILWPFPLNMLDTVRLLELDAPERGHNGWAASRLALLGLLTGEQVMFKSVWWTPIRRGRYNRILAYAWVRGHDVGQRLIADGYAWPYTKFGVGPMAKTYAMAYAEALDHGRGLWKDYDQPGDTNRKRSPVPHRRQAGTLIPPCNPN